MYLIMCHGTCVASTVLIIWYIHVTSSVLTRQHRPQYVPQCVVKCDPAHVLTIYIFHFFNSCLFLYLWLHYFLKQLFSEQRNERKNSFSPSCDRNWPIRSQIRQINLEKHYHVVEKISDSSSRILTFIIKSIIYKNVLPTR